MALFCSPSLLVFAKLDRSPRECGYNPAEPPTAADGGPAVLRGSVVLSQVGGSAATAAERER
jgi:hypothetical protein